MKRALAGVIVLLTGMAGAHAADFGQTGVSPLPVPPSSSPSFLSELRLGGAAHDPGGPESGSVDLNGEILTAKPFIGSDPIINLFIPRIHLGGSVNLSGRTSYGYAGLTWTFDLTPNIFIEGTFGGAIHNGETDPIVRHHDALGCQALFRESGSLGFRVSTNWSVMATVEHLSNAGLCANNRGLTNVGLRVGYTF